MNSADSLYNGLKVIVTGGLGFIGSNLAIRLAGLGAEVLVIDSMAVNTGANRANLSGSENKLRIAIADLVDCDEMAELIPGHAVIFNLAGRASHIDSMNDPLSDLDANVRAHLVLLEACRRYAPKARVVFASTRQVYGRPVSCPVDETHPLHPVDVNGIHKVASEFYHTLYYQHYGLQTVSLRLTNTFGPRMRVKDARQTFLGIWIRHAVENTCFEVWGGRQKRDLTYIDDAVDALLYAGVLSSLCGGIFNLGGCAPVALAELAESLVRIAGGGVYEIREYPPELLRIDIGDYFADDRLFRSRTGWEPRTTIQEGLTRTVAYYRSRLADYV